MKKYILIFLFAFIILLLWSILYKLKIFNPIILPGPKEVLESLVQMFFNKTIWPDIKMTLWRIVLSTLSGSVGGLFLGGLMGIFKNLYHMLSFWLDFSRSIPGPVFLPIIMLFFGLGEISKIIMAGIITGLLIALHTIYGLHNSNQTRLATGKSFKLKKIDFLFHVIIPEALPNISTGIRTALSFSLITVIVSEMVTSTEFGLGRLIINYQLTYNTASMYAVVFIIGLLGYTINKLYLIFETKHIHWAGK